MNRLVITILLVLAFAVSFAKLAFADGPPATDSATVIKKKIKDRTKQLEQMDAASAGTASSSAATAAPATPTLPSTLKITDICGTDKDCLSEEFTQNKDGKEENYKITNSITADGKFTATVHREACDCAITEAMAKVEITTDIKPTQTDDLKALAKKAMAMAEKNLNAYNNELAAKEKLKFYKDTCQYTDKSTYKMNDEGEAVFDLKKFAKPKVKKSRASDNPDDAYADDYTPSELDPVVACQEESMKRLEDSTKDEDIEAVNILVRKFDKRFAELHAKSALGTMTEADLEEYKNMSDFQTDVIAKNDTMSEVSAKYFFDAAKKEQADLAAKIALANNNPGQAAGILATLNKTAALQYQSDLQLAVGNRGNLDKSDKDYAANVAFLNGLGKDPANDLLNTVKKMNDALPTSEKIAAGAGPFSSLLNQLQGTASTTGQAAADVAWSKYLKDATGKFAVRGDGTNDSSGALDYAAVMVKEPLSAQCLAAINQSIASSACAKVNATLTAAAHFSPATVGGSGFMASQSATNYNNPANLAARGSNTMTSFSPNRSF